MIEELNKFFKNSEKLDIKLGAFYEHVFKKLIK